MKNINSLSGKSLNSTLKDTSPLNQIQTIFLYLQNHTATASMASAETGIPQKNITRYKRDLEQLNQLWEIERKDCQKTGFKAWWLTTDPSKAPRRSAIQLTLF